MNAKRAREISRENKWYRKQEKAYKRKAMETLYQMLLSSILSSIEGEARTGRKLLCYKSKEKEFETQMVSKFKYTGAQLLSIIRIRLRIKYDLLKLGYFTVLLPFRRTLIVFW